jgi:hypothetical protein
LILNWEGTYSPSSAELYDSELKRPVPSIILGSSIILTWEGTYSRSFGEQLI